MHIKYGVNKSFLELKESITLKIKKAKHRIRSNYNDKSVIIPEGEFKSRWGKVKGVMYEESTGEFMLLIYPYRISGGRNNSILDGFYCDLSKIDVVSDYVSGDMIKNWKTFKKNNRQQTVV